MLTKWRQREYDPLKRPSRTQYRNLIKLAVRDGRGKIMKRKRKRKRDQVARPKLNALRAGDVA